MSLICFKGVVEAAALTETPRLPCTSHPSVQASQETQSPQQVLGLPQCLLLVGHVWITPGRCPGGI